MARSSGRFSGLGRALAHRNYRLFLAGQGISLIGTWMQQIAVSWLVYDMTGSKFKLGLTAFCGQIPTFFFAPVAGVLSDRLNKRRILFVTQAVAMLQAVALVLLMWHGQLQVWQIMALSVLLGLVNAFDMPTRQAFLVDMAPSRDDLPNAIALNSSMVNGARLVGPLVAGLLIAASGPLACFVVNAVSYVAVIAALAAMRDLPDRPRQAPQRVWHGITEGFSYAWHFTPIRDLLLLLGLVSLAGMPISTLMPVFANDILKGGPQLFGALAAASGVGALTAGVYLATRPTVVGLGRVMTWGTTGLAAGLAAFAASRSIPLSIALVMIVGFALMLVLAAANTLLQTIVDDDKRGRVMSLYTMAFMGTAPLGSLWGGAIAEKFSAPLALELSAVACLAAALAFAWRLPTLRKHVRPIYEKAGILPRAAIGVGVEAAAELASPPEELA